VGHAIALSKPLILMPTQIEQSLLAHHLCLMGAAVSIPKTASTHQLVSTIKAVSDNREVMQSNIKLHRKESRDKSLVWEKDINAYIDALS